MDDNPNLLSERTCSCVSDPVPLRSVDRALVARCIETLGKLLAEIEKGRDIAFQDMLQQEAGSEQGHIIGKYCQHLSHFRYVAECARETFEAIRDGKGGAPGPVRLLQLGLEMHLDGSW